MFFSCHKIKFLFLKTPKTAAFSYVLIENIQKMARKQLENNYLMKLADQKYRYGIKVYSILRKYNDIFAVSQINIRVRNEYQLSVFT